MIYLKIEMIDSQTVKVTLTASDMLRLGTSFEKLDYSTLETKGFISKILEEIKYKAEIPPSIFSSDKIFIEAFPRKSKGCILYIDTSSRNKTGSHIFHVGGSLKPDKLPIIYEMNNISALMDAYQEILHHRESASIYLHNNKYYLLIYAENRYGIKDKKLIIAKKYGKYSGEGSVKENFLKEYGKLIAEL